MLDPPGPLIVAGPTAAGKSEIALSLAQHLGGEIISVDSMQVYRGLDIGTAKPSVAEQQIAPHHLIDVVELTESFDAAQFVRLAQAAVAAIQSRGRVPILCGGTGLYFKAFLSGLGQAPGADPALRSQLEAMPLASLLQELAQRDPSTYEKIDRQNPRRVIRALEVIRMTGKPYSQQRADWQLPSPHARFLPFSVGLTRSSGDLHRRIEARVDQMFAGGLVEETEALLRRGLAQNNTAKQALGYRQVIEYLQGVRSLPQTIELVKIRTRQFAKRQLTWFGRQLRLTWITVEPEQGPGVILEQIEKQLSGKKSH